MKPLSMLLTLSLAALPLAACSIAPELPQEQAAIRQAAQGVLREAFAEDPTFAARVNAMQACAVFPSVGKGALVLGVAYGKGVLFEHGDVVGYCDMSQGSLGLALGAQGYAEIIGFRTPEALESFKNGIYMLDAHASAVVVLLGATAQGRYSPDISLWILDEAGLMLEAAFGVQEFRYLHIGVEGEPERL